MLFIEEGIVISCKDLVYPKHLEPKTSTLGITTSYNSLHPQNADSPITCVLLGRLIVLSFLQHLNASFPMHFTPLGILMYS